MCVTKSLNRRELIEAHIASAREYAAYLLWHPWPWVRRKQVAQRIIGCADDLERSHNFIKRRERELDQ